MSKAEIYYRQKNTELSEALGELIKAVNKAIKNQPFELSEALYNAEEVFGWAET